MAVDPVIGTLEVSIASNAQTAMLNLGALANKLDSLANVISKTVTAAKGLSSIGRVDTSNVRDVLTAARDLGRAFKDIEKKKPDIVIRTENIRKAEERLDALFDKMKGATRIDIGTNKNDVATNLVILEKGLERARQRFIALAEEGGKALDGKEFRSAIESIVDYQNAIERAQDALADWDKYEASLPSLNKADFDPGVDSDVTADEHPYVSKYDNVAGDVEAQTASVGKASSAWERFASKVRTAYSFVKTVGSYLGGTLKAALKGITSAVNTARNAIGKLSSAFKSAIGHVKSFANALRHPIATLKNLFGMGGNRGGGILGGLLRGRSLGQFVGLIVLRRAVMAALRAIVNGIKEGFENIRNYSSAINSEMYSIQNSLLYVKNAWAAAFAPIVSVVRPYINYLLDAIAAALNALGRLMALLTGKGFAVQAVKLSDAMYEAGKAGESAAGGTGKAAKAAEEYKKTLMSFDQLHVLNAQDSGSGSGGSGGGGGGGASGGLDASQMFTTVSVAGAMKDAIESQNWDELGRLMAEKVNSAFGKLNELISWENVGGKITETVNAITTTLNSLVDNIDWNLIGTTFGSGINTLVNTWNLFFDKFDFVNLGSKIATGVNGLFDRIDWHELGRAVTQKFKALWDTIYGFVTTLKWGDIGVKIGSFINGAMKNINLGRVGDAIAETLNGITDALNGFTKTVNWGEFSNQIAEFFTNFFTKFRAADFIDSLSTFAGKLVRGISLALSNANVLAAIEDFGRELGKKLGSLNWLQYLADLAVAIVNALRSLLEGLLEGFVEGLLVKMGLTPNQAHNAFKDKEAFQQYALTGNPEFLPGGSLYKVPTTAVFQNSEDELTDEEKKVYNSTAVENKTKDNIPEKQKHVRNSTADLQYTNDLLTPKQRQVRDFNAQLKTATDGIAAKAKVTTGWGAKLVSSTDGIAANKKTLTNYTASVKNVTLPSGTKTVEINGKVVKVIKPNATPTIDVTANIRNTASNGWRLVPAANGGLFKHGSWQPITRYASGGSPKSAELFMAREAGPELVGRIGSHTAVMNNNQIVSSVARGVESAVYRAMSAANGGGNSSPYEIHVTVKTQDDEVLARAVERGQAKRKYRLGTAMG